MGRIETLYLEHYKKLLLIPIILLLFSLIILGVNYYNSGSFIKKDVSLQGGVSLTINTDKAYNINQLEAQIEIMYPNSDVSIRELSDFSIGKRLGLTFEISNVKIEDIQDDLAKLLEVEFTEENFSAQEIGSTFGKSFFKDMIFALMFSLLFMAIVVFVTFRKIIPSIAVISSVILDLIVTLAILVILDYRLSPAGIAAMLMVIGYSIDTDILLTTRILKRDVGTLFQRIKGATKTGFTMTITTLAVSLLMLLTPSAVLKEIFTILVIALVIDMISTWIMNTSILIWYVKNKGII